MVKISSNSNSGFPRNVGSSVYTGLFKMIVGVLTICHTQYTWDSSICVFLFNRTTLQVFVTYRTGALYVHPLWFYKHQHDNRVRSKLFVACQRWWLQWRVWFVPSVPGYTCTPCLLKLCIPPSNGTVRWWLFPEFGAELPLDNCTTTFILNNPVFILPDYLALGICTPLH